MKIEEKIKMVEDELSRYNEQIEKYLDEHGNDNCEYLIHIRLMKQYYLGQHNLLKTIKKGEIVILKR